MKKPEIDPIFALGEENPFGQYFVGQSYLKMLCTEGVGIGNVTFEPGCRNNWHIHHAQKGGGQILLCTAGRGWYQEWGKPAQPLHPGDVVKIPPGSSTGTARRRTAGLRTFRSRCRARRPATNGWSRWMTRATTRCKRRFE